MDGWKAPTQLMQLPTTRNESIVMDGNVGLVMLTTRMRQDKQSNNGTLPSSDTMQFGVACSGALIPTQSAQVGPRGGDGVFVRGVIFDFGQGEKKKRWET